MAADHLGSVPPGGGGEAVSGHKPTGQALADRIQKAQAVAARWGGWGEDENQSLKEFVEELAWRGETIETDDDLMIAAIKQILVWRGESMDSFHRSVMEHMVVHLEARRTGEKP